MSWRKHRLKNDYWILKKIKERGGGRDRKRERNIEREKRREREREWEKDR